MDTRARAVQARPAPPNAGTKHLTYRIGPTHGRSFCDDRNRGGAGQAIGADANRRWVDQTPLGRFGRLGEVAALVLYLIRDKASFVTGQICGVAGGLLMT
jgi:3-oxoacyl-[acyl-carrier protein] reductase